MSRFGHTRQSIFILPSIFTVTTTRPYSRVALPLARIVQPADEADVSKCVWTIASAFDRVPCTNAFSAESGQTVLNYVNKTIRSSISRNGVLIEAADTSAVALWELPNLHRVAEGPGSTSSGGLHNRTDSDQHIKNEWKQVVQLAKMKYIGTERNSETDDITILPHYHLDFLARNPSVPKIPGAISAVVLPYLAKAKQDRLSVWLEATSLDVVTLYKHFGFRVLEEITIGVGRVDGQGKLQNEGEGFKAWLMWVDNDGSLKL
ncbi:hypothetical protein B0T25DRAFT_530853 [Lasiosphaeria hispida]|uniref:N-acetyltransferase domain-containing protein n=1 Tax=Lasiosphaeria hispida TaxID=260671 RepID=A0AAJ0HXX0_9PEZI|nr:hypothetical protein B0T25DRAFT_530853 [Lasiosphaeria hispida]